MKRQFLALRLLAATTFGVLGSSLPALADTVSEREKNNTDLTAQVLPHIPVRFEPVFTEHILKGSATNSDTDFYRFDLGTASRLTISLTPRSSIAVVFADLYYDDNRNGRAEASEKVDTIKNSLSARTLEGLRFGTYFIKVFASLPLFTASYDLTLQVTTGVFQREVEPNNTSAQANVVQGFLVGGRDIAGGVIGPDTAAGSDDGRDYYRFTVGTARPVTVNLANIGSGAFFNLYHDKNRNGLRDTGEFLTNVTVDNRGYAILRDQFLVAGEYLIEAIKPFGSGSAKYSVTLVGD